MKRTYHVRPVLQAPCCVWLDDAFAGGRALTSQSAYSFRCIEGRATDLKSEIIRADA